MTCSNAVSPSFLAQYLRMRHTDGFLVRRSSRRAHCLCTLQAFARAYGWISPGSLAMACPTFAERYTAGARTLAHGVRGTGRDVHKTRPDARFATRYLVA